MDKKFKVGDYVSLDDGYIDERIYKIIGLCDHHDKSFYILENFYFGAVAENILTADFHKTLRSRIDKTTIEPIGHHPRFKLKDSVKFKGGFIDDPFMLVDFDKFMSNHNASELGKITKVLPPEICQTQEAVACQYKYRVSYRAINWNKQDSLKLLSDTIIGGSAILGIILGTMSLLKLSLLWVLAPVIPSCIMLLVIADRLSHIKTVFKMKHVEVFEDEIRINEK